MEPEPEAGRGDPGDIADALAYGELLGDALVPAPSNTHIFHCRTVHIGATVSLEGSALPDPQRGGGRKGSRLEKKSGARVSVLDLLWGSGQLTQPLWSQVSPSVTNCPMKRKISNVEKGL